MARSCIPVRIRRIQQRLTIDIARADLPQMRRAIVDETVGDLI
jgi:hypothetical protein